MLSHRQRAASGTSLVSGIMSSEDEGDCFVGEGGQLHEGHQEVADLPGQAAATWEDEDAVACSPSSEVVATGGADDKVFLWQVGRLSS